MIPLDYFRNGLVMMASEEIEEVRWGVYLVDLAAPTSSHVVPFLKDDKHTDADGDFIQRNEPLPWATLRLVMKSSSPCLCLSYLTVVQPL